jgi:hypothetical protein
MKSTIRALVAIVPFLAFACSGACGATLTPAQINDVSLGVDATVCILTHITEPPAQIAQACLTDPTDIADVNKVLAAHYAAESREKVLPDAGQ